MQKCNCGKPIINKKYGLCNECNYVRLNGRSRSEVYQERADSKPKPIYTLKRSKPKQQSSREASVKNKLHNVKLQHELDAVQSDEYYCKGCGVSYLGLDKSHILSVGQRKDLETDPENIRLHCRKCHMGWESNEMSRMIILDCFEADMEYIAKHDSARLSALLTKIEEWLVFNEEFAKKLLIFRAKNILKIFP